jgi:preprotein translocase subunit SecE
MNLKVYKNGQGYYTRLISALTAGVVVLIGCYQLWNKLGAVAFSSNQNTNFLIQTFVPLIVAAAFSWLIWWLSNRPTVADFLIAGEGEMKKVSWSSRKEITTSTIVVICVVIVMSAMMAISDLVFQMFFKYVVRL